MSESQREFHDGELIGGTRYQVVSMIGAGGMGCVYLVEHTELGKHFVLKSLLRELAGRKDLVARLRNEWRALAKLEHPNIVNVTDAGTSDGGVPFYVMERLDGCTLGQKLRAAGRLLVPDAIDVAVGVLDGLSAAHDIGIVHRDVKPPNIFVMANGSVKLLDFGIAKVLDRDAAKITGRGLAVGTPRYMSPEQARGERVDGRVDLYATGLILFEMIAGRGPFDGTRDANELLLAQIGTPAPALSSVAPGVARELDGLLHRLLSKDPRDRPQTARSVANELLALRARYRRQPAATDAPTPRVDFDARTEGAEFPPAARVSGSPTATTAVDGRGSSPDALSGPTPSTAPHTPSASFHDATDTFADTPSTAHDLADGAAGSTATAIEGRAERSPPKAAALAGSSSDGAASTFPTEDVRSTVSERGPTSSGPGLHDRTLRLDELTRNETAPTHTAISNTPTGETPPPVAPFETPMPKPGRSASGAKKLVVAAGAAAVFVFLGGITWAFWPDHERAEASAQAAAPAAGTASLPASSLPAPPSAAPIAARSAAAQLPSAPSEPPSASSEAASAASAPPRDLSTDTRAPPKKAVISGTKPSSTKTTSATPRVPRAAPPPPAAKKPQKPSPTLLPGSGL